MAAFMAAEKGMKVSRLDKEVQIAGKILGKGSFVISGGDAASWPLLQKRRVPSRSTQAGQVPSRQQR